MRRCTPACFNADQGRHCLCSTNASRAALGLGPIVFPEDEEDEPLAPESADSAWAVVQSVLAYIAVSLLTLAAVSILSTGAT